MKKMIILLVLLLSISTMAAEIVDLDFSDPTLVVEVYPGQLVVRGIKGMKDASGGPSSKKTLFAHKVYTDNDQSVINGWLSIFMNAKNQNDKVRVVYDENWNNADQNRIISMYLKY